MTIRTRTATFVALLALAIAPRLDAQSSKITVTIGGGAHAGTYEMTALYCELHADQFPPIDFEANSAGTSETKGPASISFFTGSERGDGFGVSVRFHVKRGERYRYEIFTVPRNVYPRGRELTPTGSGTVTVKQTATGKTASFRGQTQDGVRMEGVVDCRRRAS